MAIHPIADQMCDEFPCFAWLLRALAFNKFGYDPDQVLSNDPHDEYGFVGKSCFVIPQKAITGERAQSESVVQGPLVVPPAVATSEEKSQIMERVAALIRENPFPPTAPRYTRDELHERR